MSETNLPFPSNEEALKRARKGIPKYLESQFKSGGIAENYFAAAMTNVVKNLTEWMHDPNIDRLSPNLKPAVHDAVKAERWEDLVNAYVRHVTFGTGGIRGLMGFDRNSILRLKKEGIGARILKGPNTINEIVLLLKSAGVARFANHRGFEKIVIGYDSRIRGKDFAEIISRLFLAYGLKVYLFDDPCPYPEVTYSIPSEAVKADIGILISASHNDFRYNGYKLSCGNGSQFSIEERNFLYFDFIEPAVTDQIKLMDFSDTPADRLVYLGGEEKDNSDGYGHRTIDMHSKHVGHTLQFVLRKDMIKKSKDPLVIGYSAFHGAGRKNFPRLLVEAGFRPALKIMQLDALDGMFPCFRSDPGKEQQPDPGDPRAADTAVKAFKDEYPGKWDDVDILIGTDPDADRCGVIVKVPPEQRDIYDTKDTKDTKDENDYYLLMADEAWALLIWYRLKYEVEKYGKIVDPEKKFIVESHTSSDVLMKLAKKYGLGFIKTWVGFAMLSNSISAVWSGEELPRLREGKLNEDDFMCNPVIWESFDMWNGKRSINFAASEQSNGFSILGGPPKDAVSLGEGGHVRDKDGTLAGLLMAEMAAYAKENNTTLLELFDREISLDPDIGLFINCYEPDPIDGEYPGLKGDTHKKNILDAAIRLYDNLMSGGKVALAGMPVVSSRIYRTGKYDAANGPGFPDEGIRFYFDKDRLNWFHIRPSGTSNSMRFHVQLHAYVDSYATLLTKKRELYAIGRRMIFEIRELLGAPKMD